MGIHNIQKPQKGISLTPTTTSKLSIVIPTYNRANFLEHLLESHMPMLEKHQVKVFISDNGSTDETCKIIERLKEKYPSLYYHQNKENLGADLNIETALKMPETDYIWLLGDTYNFCEDVLIYVLKSLDSNYDHILLNVGNEVKTVTSQIYTDQNKLLDDLFWLMTCLSVHIYSRKLINNANFKRYRGCHFLQTGILLEYIDQNKFNICWSLEHSVDRKPEIKGVKKTTWNDRFFEIWIESRVNFALSLPPTYKLSSKIKGARSVSAEYKALSLKQILAFRANSTLNFRTATKYKHALRLCCSRPNLLILLLCSILPSIFFSPIRYLYRLRARQTIKNQ
ncbi:glycosyltransferase family 2 protein [Pseudomonas protegens]|uniref:glycosyltransferase family 2 protein n=1 Tax=Pseudomonas protegens TaxID=380021 RepID=UPI000B0B8415|nr:glycosyltransferase family 2 protein [Pseudomonas protegens]